MIYLALSYLNSNLHASLTASGEVFYFCHNIELNMDWMFLITFRHVSYLYIFRQFSQFWSYYAYFGGLISYIGYTCGHDLTFRYIKICSLFKKCLYSENDQFWEIYRYDILVWRTVEYDLAGITYCHLYRQVCRDASGAGNCLSPALHISIEIRI